MILRSSSFDAVVEFCQVLLGVLFGGVEALDVLVDRLFLELPQEDLEQFLGQAGSLPSRETMKDELFLICTTVRSLNSSNAGSAY